MASTTIHSLVYKVTADAQQFKAGITATRSELSAAKKLMMETKTPAEKLGASIESLNRLHQKGAIDATTHARALDRLNKEFKELNTGGAGGGIGAFASRTALGVAGGLGIATSLDAAISSMVNFTTQSIEAAEEAVRSERKLQAVMDATGNAVGFNARQLSDYAGVLQHLTGVEDETIMSAQAILATFRNVQGSVFTDAIRLALDMAAVMDTDLGSAARQLGKALNDPIQGLSSLSRVGVQFTEEQKEQIRVLQESGKVMEAQGVILEQLAGKFEGAAERMKTPLDGLKNSFGEVQEEVGKFFAAGEKGGEMFQGWAIGLDTLGDSLRRFREGEIGAFQFARELDPITFFNRSRDMANRPKLVPNPAPAGPPVPGIGIDALPGFDGMFKGDAEARKLRDDAFGDAVAFADSIEKQHLALAGFSQERIKLIELMRRGVPVHKLEEIQGQIDAVARLKEEKRLTEELAKEEEQRRESLRRDADRFREMGKTPGEKLGEELARIQQAMDAGDLSPEAGKLASDKLMKDFEGQFPRRRLPSRTAGAALERGSSEAFSAIMRGADRNRGKLEQLPDIAKEQLKVAHEMVEALKARNEGAVEMVLVE